MAGAVRSEMLLHLGRPATSLLFVAVMAALSALSPLPAQEIQFRFAPPDGAIEEHRVKVSRVTQLEGEDDQVDEIERVVRVEKRQTAGGFTVTERLISAASSHDGEPTDNPILAALREIDIIKEAGDDGSLQAVRGYEKIAAILMSKFPEEVTTDLLAALDETAMAAQARSEWEATIGRFAGKRVRIGDVWNGGEGFPLGGRGEVHVLASIRFSRIVPCGNRRCVVLDLSYRTEEDGAAGEVDNVFEGAAHERGQWVDQTGAALRAVSGKGERVIDPATMDLISEKIERTIRMLVEVPGEGKLPMVIRETSETVVKPGS